ncbi:MAG: hypothetical protein K2X77_08810, partial [Candidatus Obscuribacterales bacterium]|nr:hypothetical protein [Candidatus Obscuribacterales bacterium]
PDSQMSELLWKDRSRQDAGAPGIEPDSQMSELLWKDRSRQDAGAPGIEPNSQMSELLWKDRSRQDAGTPGIEPDSQMSESLLCSGISSPWQTRSLDLAKSLFRWDLSVSVVPYLLELHSAA